MCVIVPDDLLVGRNVRAEDGDFNDPDSVHPGTRVCGCLCMCVCFYKFLTTIKFK
jgi:hypothetical protein